MKVRLWLLVLGTCLVSSLIGGQKSFGQSEYQSLGLVKLAQAETQNVSREVEIERVNQLNRRGFELHQQGRYSEATAVFEEVLETKSRLYEGDHPDVASSLNTLAILYVSQERYSDAESLITEALEINKRLFPGDHLNVAKSLTTLAFLYKSQRRYSKAEPFYIETLSMKKRLFQDDNPEIALSQTNLGVIYVEQGRYAEAEPLLTEALAMRKRLFKGSNRSVANSLSNLAGLYNEQGRYAEAELLYVEALAMRKRLFQNDHPHVIFSLNFLGVFYRHQGRYAEAESLYIEALAMSQQFQNDHPLRATALNNLALLYKSQGRYTEAEPLYIESLAKRKSFFMGDHPDVANSLNNLASLYKSQGRFAEAIPYYTEALEMRKRLFPGDHPDVVTSLNNLGLLHSNSENYSEAESLFTQALAMSKRLYKKDHPNVATILNSLGGLYLAQGKYREAEHVYTEALEIRLRFFQSDNFNVANSLNNLAANYLNQGKYGKAEPLFTEALAMRKRLFPKSHLSIASSLNNFSWFYIAQAKYSEALDYLTQATEIEESILSENLIIGSEKQKKQFIDLFQSSTYRNISFHLNAIPKNKQAAELALTNILRRKGRILDAMGQNLQTLRDNLDPESEKLLNDLTDAQTQFASIAYQPLSDDPNKRKNIQRLQANLDQKIKTLEAKLSSRNTEFQQQNTPVTITQVQQAIPKDAALVEFIQYRPFNSKENKFSEPHYAVYVLLPNGEIQWQYLGEAASINAKIAEFRKLLGKPPVISNSNSDQKEGLDRAGGLVPILEEEVNSIEEVKQAARELDKLLMQPVRAMTDDATHLLISPDSELNILPFAALVDEQDKYLVENYLITYLTSGRDLLRLQLNQDQQPSSPLLLANPDYSAEGVLTLAKSSGKENEDSRGRRSAELAELVFSSLPGTEAEGAAIKQLIPKFELFTEQKASENNLKNKQNQNPEFLHLATHGFFIAPEEEANDINSRNNNYVSGFDNDRTPVFSTAENPLLRSGLALAGFNQRKSGKEDGVLTALEVTGLNLRGTKLVVTSACETGLGDVQAGEGIYGLRRAFTLAGAQSQLMSLWKVSDEGTKDLMVNYYSKIQNGEARGEAFRQVQLEMLQSEEYAHPFYWAAFIPSGSWLPLD